MGQTLSNKKLNFLKIRCSDGRSRKPDEIRGNFIHQIRLPGGILFPDLCAQHLFTNKWKQAVVSKLLRRVQLFAIDMMVKLKSPDKIYVMSHNHCGAAEAIGVSNTEVKRVHLEFGNELRQRFPHIPVVVLHDPHSECGEYHNGHELLEAAQRKENAEGRLATFRTFSFLYIII